VDQVDLLSRWQVLHLPTLRPRQPIYQTRHSYNFLWIPLDMWRMKILLDLRFCMSPKHAPQNLFKSSLFMDLAGQREGHGHTPKQIISGQHGYMKKRDSRMFELQHLDIIPISTFWLPTRTYPFQLSQTNFSSTWINLITEMDRFHIRIFWANCRQRPFLLLIVWEDWLLNR